MEKLAHLAIVATLAVAPALASTGGGNLNIAHGLLAFGVPSSAGAPEPCVGTATSGMCYGVPYGLLVVPMNGLVAPGTSGIFYVSIETQNFSGTGSTTFKLTESGTLALQLAATGAISTNSKTFISAAGAIPAGTYTGPATLTAMTTVTPATGSSPVVLTAQTSLWIVPSPGSQAEAAGAARPPFAQMAVGFGIPPPPMGTGRSAPCVGTGAADNCYGAPVGIFVLPLNLLAGGSGVNLGGLFFIAVQIGRLTGSATTLYQFSQGGNVLEESTASGQLLFANRFAAFGDSAYIPGMANPGPATLTATTTVYYQGVPYGTLASSINVQVQ